MFSSRGPRLLSIEDVPAQSSVRVPVVPDPVRVLVVAGWVIVDPPSSDSVVDPEVEPEVDPDGGVGVVCVW
jgi:hypothetical protein